MDIRKFNPGKTVSSLGTWRPVDATGGVESFITVSGIRYKLHVFTSTGSTNLIINSSGSDGLVEYLVVAGGGGGGMDMAGGGGGGGVLSGRHSVGAGQVIPITVGVGGMAGPGGSRYRVDGAGPNPGGHQFTVSATNGGNSVFGPYTAIGGGYGGSSYFDYTPNSGTGATGGSGGGTSGYANGATNVKLGAQGVSGQGFRGGQGGGQYYSGGGGGAGGQGIDSTGVAHGGPGRLSNILGFDLYWGGGGGGAAYTRSTGGNGGIGGGGGGAVGTTTGGAGYNPGQAGLGGGPSSHANTRGGSAGANTGGGGGGGSHYNANNDGGNGGSGIVVIRYPINSPFQPLLPVQSGLILNLDANNINSYPGSGFIWNDLSGVMGNVNVRNRSNDWSFATSPEGVKGVYNATNRTANNSPGINVPVNNGFNKVSGTIDIWVRPLDSGPGHGFFVNSDGSSYTNASNWIWVGVWETNIIYFRQGNASTCCNDLTISRWAETYYIPNKWHNLTFSWNVASGSAKIYFNGLPYASTTGIPTNVPNSNPTTTGQLFNGHGRGDNMQFKGYCSTYRIYNRQLTDQEVLQNYDSSKSIHKH